MGSIPPGALDELNLAIYSQSTPTAVVEEGTAFIRQPQLHRRPLLSRRAGRLVWQRFRRQISGQPGEHHASTFATSGKVVRSDFYQLTPTGSSNVKGTWLGYFELNPNGAMTFVAKPTTTPVSSTFSRNGNTVTITYKTGLYGTYNLLGTNDMTAPPFPHGRSLAATCPAGTLRPTPFRTRTAPPTSFTSSSANENHRQA